MFMKSREEVDGFAVKNRVSSDILAEQSWFQLIKIQISFLRC